MRYTADQLIEKRKQKWAETGSIDYDKRLRKAIARELVKDAQLLRPLFEFSGACAGCGETPYVKQPASSL